MWQVAVIVSTLLIGACDQKSDKPSLHAERLNSLEARIASIEIRLGSLGDIEKEIASIRKENEGLMSRREVYLEDISRSEKEIAALQAQLVAAEAKMSDIPYGALDWSWQARSEVKFFGSVP